MGGESFCWAFAGGGTVAYSLWSLRSNRPGANTEAAALATIANTDQSAFGYAPPEPPPGLYHTASTHPNPEEVEGFHWRPPHTPAHAQTFRTRIPNEWTDSFVDDGFVLVKQLFADDEVVSCLAAIESICAEQVDSFNAEATLTQAMIANGELNGANGSCEAILQFEPAARGVPKGARGHLIRKVANYHKYDDLFPQLALQNHPGVRQLAHALLGLHDGQEIEVFQSIALLKPPAGQ